MRRIAIFYHGNLDEQSGGVARVSAWLARNLCASGRYEVIAITRCGMRPSSVKECETLFVSNSSRRLAAQKIEEIVRERKIDLIINQSSFYDSALVLRNSGTRVITVVHYNPTPIRTEVGRKEVIGNWKGRLYARLYNSCPRGMILLSAWRQRNVIRRVSEFSSGVCFLSPSYCHAYDDAMRGTSNRVCAIANPIPFDSKPSQTCYGKIVLYVGRLTHVEKRLDWLLRIWKTATIKHMDWRLILVGEGRDKQNLVAYVEENKLENVEFVGRCDPRPYYERASVICLTSPSEGFPLVLPEAMSHGVVPILFDSFGAAHDIVDNGESGALIRPFDFAAYANELDRLMSIDLSQMGRAARNKATEFSGDRIFKSWERLINETLLYQS